MAILTYALANIFVVYLPSSHAFKPSSMPVPKDHDYELRCKIQGRRAASAFFSSHSRYFLCLRKAVVTRLCYVGAFRRVAGWECIFCWYVFGSYFVTHTDTSLVARYCLVAVRACTLL